MHQQLGALPAISLDHLRAEAEFLTRKDRKYLVPASLLPDFFARLDGEARILEIDGQRLFTYITPYFDDPERSLYLLAARKRPNRFKVRTRFYADSNVQFLEVKLRDSQGRTVKHRIDHRDGRLETLTGDELDWIAQFPQIGTGSRQLRHCVTTEYRRATLVLPNGAGRVTIDQDLRFIKPEGGCYDLSGLLTIETKSAGKPTSADRVLWRLGARPVAMSKFATGMGLFHPDLPANRWNRVLSRLAETASFVSAGDPAETVHAR